MGRGVRHNGKLGQVVDYDETLDKYLVKMLESGEIVRTNECQIDTQKQRYAGEHYGYRWDTQKKGQRRAVEPPWGRTGWVDEDTGKTVLYAGEVVGRGEKGAPRISEA